MPPEIQQIVFALEAGSGPLLDIPTSTTQQAKEYFVVKGQLFAVVGGAHPQSLIHKYEPTRR